MCSSDLLYPLPRPFIPGMEGAGVVEAVGEGVTEVAVGDRVAYAMQIGAYAERATIPAWKLVRIPDGVDEKAAAALMLQGMTAHYLTTSVYPLKAGETALVHAAAGGAGLILTQLIKRIGAQVIGTVSTPAKAELARAAGADEVILYTEQDFEQECRRLTGGNVGDGCGCGRGAGVGTPGVHAFAFELADAGRFHVSLLRCLCADPCRRWRCCPAARRCPPAAR